MVYCSGWLKLCILCGSLQGPNFFVAKAVLDSGSILPQASPSLVNDWLGTGVAYVLGSPLYCLGGQLSPEKVLNTGGFSHPIDPNLANFSVNYRCPALEGGLCRGRLFIFSF